VQRFGSGGLRIPLYSRAAATAALALIRQGSGIKPLLHSECKSSVLPVHEVRDDCGGAKPTVGLL